MSSIKYVTSFDAYIDECKRIVNMRRTTKGDCKSCKLRTLCLQEYKRINIESVMSMESDKTRFPLLLDATKGAPFVLESVPSVIFERMYGAYKGTLPCPFVAKAYCKHLKELRNVYDLLTDEQSKQVFLNILMYRITLNKEYIWRAYSAEPQYFIKEFRGLGKDEVYVDCGAFTGDTYEEYCRYNECPKMAYLFEPDSDNLARIKEFTDRTGNTDKTTLISKCVYSDTRNLYFVKRGGPVGYLTEDGTNGGEVIPVTSIDDAIAEDITFIKMDIEGSEQKALEGAGNHISSCYPKLAICIYHKPEDFWEIPLGIKNKYPDYNHFAIRHHEKSVSETVLYVWRQ